MGDYKKNTFRRKCRFRRDLGEITSKKIFIVDPPPIFPAASWILRSKTGLTIFDTRKWNQACPDFHEKHRNQQYLIHAHEIKRAPIFNKNNTWRAQIKSSMPPCSLRPQRAKLKILTWKHVTGMDFFLDIFFSKIPFFVEKTRAAKTRDQRTPQPSTARIFAKKNHIDYR